MMQKGINDLKVNLSHSPNCANRCTQEFIRPLLQILHLYSSKRQNLTLRDRNRELGNLSR